MKTNQSIADTFPNYEQWLKLCEASNATGQDIDLGEGIGFDKGSKMFGRIKNGSVFGALFISEQEARTALTLANSS